MTNSGQEKTADSRAQTKPLPRDQKVVDKVRAALLERKGSWRAISRRATKDNTLTYRWISAFAADEIEDPSYTRLAALARYLDINIGVLNGNAKVKSKKASPSP